VTLKDAGVMFAKSGGWAEQHVALLKLPEAWKMRVIRKSISLHVAEEVARFAHDAAIVAAIDAEMEMMPWAFQDKLTAVRNLKMVAARVISARENGHLPAAAAAATNGKTNGRHEPKPPRRPPARPPITPDDVPSETYLGEVATIVGDLRKRIAHWPRPALTLLRRELGALLVEAASTAVPSTNS
jgi:hypothetical protein